MPRTFIRRFQTIDYLIQKRRTGTASQLAERLEVSERTAKEFIAIMKELGAPIYFDRARGSYCYREAGGFNIFFGTVQRGCTMGSELYPQNGGATVSGLSHPHPAAGGPQNERAQTLKTKNNMQTLELSKYQLAPISDSELQETDGGILPALVIIGCGLLLSGCVQNNQQNNNHGKVTNVYTSGQNVGDSVTNSNSGHLHVSPLKK